MYTWNFDMTSPLNNRAQSTGPTSYSRPVSNYGAIKSSPDFTTSFNPTAVLRARRSDFKDECEIAHPKINKWLLEQQNSGYVSTTADTTHSELNNPLTRDLPPPLSAKDAIAMLQQNPAPRPVGFADALAHVRRTRINDIGHVYVPGAQHLVIFDLIYTTTVASLSQRNPLIPENVTRIYETALFAREAMKSQTAQVKLGRPVRPLDGIEAKGIAILGPTGVGKSRLLDRIEWYFNSSPRWISDMNGPCRWPRVPVVRIQCPPGGTLNGIGASIHAKLDELTGTAHLRRSSRLTKDTMEPQLCAALSQAYVGILVVEDIHHLRECHSNRKHLLRFFANLTETTGIPVALVGTPPATEVLDEIPSLGGKLRAGGTVTLSPLSNGIEFAALIDTYWTWRVSHFEITVPPAFLYDAVYFHTQGIPRVICLLMSGLFYAMTFREESSDISSDLLESIVPTALQGYLEALAVVRRRHAGDIVTAAERRKYEEFFEADAFDVQEDTAAMLARLHQSEIFRKRLEKMESAQVETISKDEAIKTKKRDAMRRKRALAKAAAPQAKAERTSVEADVLSRDAPDTPLNPNNLAGRDVLEE